MNTSTLLTILTIVWFTFGWVLRITALFVVPRHRRPSSGLSWLLVIFLAPELGFLTFLIIGSPKLPAHRRKAQQSLDMAIMKVNRQTRDDGNKHGFVAEAVGEKYQPLATLAENLTGLPAMAGNTVEVLSDYQKIIDRLVADIDCAKHYVHLEYYILAYDETTKPVFDALARAVARGVDTRVLYDWLASVRTKKYTQMKKSLVSSGINHAPMLAFKLPGKGYVRPDLRNHRKLVAIDGKIGYTGSQNLIRRDYNRKDDIYYDEVVTRITGPLVLQLSVVFITDWFTETGEMLSNKQLLLQRESITTSGNSIGQILPSGPGYNDENNLKVFIDLIHAARTSITIVNPYFVPDEALMSAVTTASKRGVKVLMINSEAIDQWMVAHAQRSFYDELLSAGVDIYLYNAPILLHTKYMVVDDEIAVIGSSNLDIRSFLLDLEVTLISYDKNVAKQLAKVTAAYLKRSKGVSLEYWRKRPLHLLLLDNLARLTSSLQ